DGHVIVGDNLLVRPGEFTVAAAFRSEVHDDRARLHRLDHVLGPENRSRTAGDERRGDDNVHVRSKLTELGQLLLAELWARRGCIAAGGRTVLSLFELEEDEFCAH